MKRSLATLGRTRYGPYLPLGAAIPRRTPILHAGRAPSLPATRGGVAGRDSPFEPEPVYYGVKWMLLWVALLAAMLAGCGGHASSTRLRIEVADGTGLRVYRLQCGPARGTARNPEAMCAALRRQPDMLSTPSSIVCGPSGAPTERIRVSGSSRGKPVRVEFADACIAGGDGVGAWIDVLEGA